jgi:hypothetical protein
MNTHRYFLWAIFVNAMIPVSLLLGYVQHSKAGTIMIFSSLLWFVAGLVLGGICIGHKISFYRKVLMMGGPFLGLLLFWVIGVSAGIISP